MRIVCPGCHAAYEVPSELVAERPVVRCVQCHQEWQAGPTTPPSRNRADEDEPPAPIPIRPPASMPEEVPANARAPAAAADSAAVAELERPVVAEPASRPVATEAPAPDPAPAATRQLTAADLIETRPRHRRILASIAGNLVAITAWTCSLGFLLALGWMVVEHRSRIMLVWPPSQRLFEWLGLA